MITLIVLVVAVIAIQLFVKKKVVLDNGQTGTVGGVGGRSAAPIEYEIIDEPITA